ncbi:MAG: tyrosine-type recombinase/integrase [Candidatus Dormibacteraceae bacterium]
MGLQKLNDGRYRVFVDMGRDSNGKRLRHTEVIRGTKRQAEDRERELLYARRNGTYVEPHRLTVAEFMKNWLASVERSVSPNTYRGYEQRTRTHIIRDLGHIKLLELSPLHIEGAEKSWMESGNRRTVGPLDPQTVLHIHRVLYEALDRAIKWRLIPLNPVDGVDAPHVPDKDKAFLTIEESERLTVALEGSPYDLPILFGLYCGMRPAEYLALRWQDVDFADGDIRVTQNVHRVRQDEMTTHMGVEVWGFRFGPAKTHRSKRPLSVPDSLLALLSVWKLEQTAIRLQAATWADLDLVFTDTRGYPHNHDRVRRAFYKALKQAKIRQVVLYALRHTMATITLHETKDLKLVATRLGHANEMLVLKTYGHLLPGVDREAAKQLGKVIRLRGQIHSETNEAGGHTNGTFGG